MQPEAWEIFPEFHPQIEQLRCRTVCSYVEPTKVRRIDIIIKERHFKVDVRTTRARPAGLPVPPAWEGRVGELHPRYRKSDLSDQACAVLSDGVLHVGAIAGLDEINWSGDETPTGPSLAV